MPYRIEDAEDDEEFLGTEEQSRIAECGIVEVGNAGSERELTGERCRGRCDRESCFELVEGSRRRVV